MSKVFAVVVNNKVSNVAVFESLESAQQELGEGAVPIEIVEGVRNPDTGSTWDGENFHAPVVEEVAPEATTEEPVTE